MVRNRCPRAALGGPIEVDQGGSARQIGIWLSVGAPARPGHPGCRRHPSRCLHCPLRIHHQLSTRGAIGTWLPAVLASVCSSTCPPGRRLRRLRDTQILVFTWCAPRQPAPDPPPNCSRSSRPWTPAAPAWHLQLLQLGLSALSAAGVSQYWGDGTARFWCDFSMGTAPLYSAWRIALEGGSVCGLSASDQLQQLVTACRFHKPTTRCAEPRSVRKV